ncbi:GreA/GreB family elongation factor [Chitinophaga defluvii]|uniref:GreA/GreB family elongation factor n=1 Tax=Chitinophaga defluvii TaxID=3163343 RepID=A0ABV2T0T9_9BACT
MKLKKINVTAHDYEILKTLCQQTGGSSKLLEELERATIKKSISDDVVRLNSTLEFKDERTGKVREVQLVLPALADIQKSRISILSPIGTALLGYSINDVVDWEVPAGKTKLHIISVKQEQETEKAPS